MLKENLAKIVEEKRQKNLPDFLIVNFLKEYLQYPVLDFLYKREKYRNFIFTGGSCLRVCYDLPRLSEDLDFDLEKRDYENMDLEELAEELQTYFGKNYLLDIETRVQKQNRVYLKFPVLHELGLHFGGGSDFLYVKIEPSEKKYKKMEAEVQAISEYGYNFILKRYALDDMMTNKIIAVFTREWLKGDQNEVDIKGRDFYDLFWFFEKGAEPNFDVLKEALGIQSMSELKTKLKDRIEKNITSQKLKRDLKNFLPDQEFANDFCNNYSRLMEKYLI